MSIQWLLFDSWLGKTFLAFMTMTWQGKHNTVRSSSQDCYIQLVRGTFVKKWLLLKSILYMFITPYRFINFLWKIQPTGLFHPTRLFGTLEYFFIYNSALHANLATNSALVYNLGLPGGGGGGKSLSSSELLSAAYLISMKRTRIFFRWFLSKCKKRMSYFKRS